MFESIYGNARRLSSLGALALLLAAPQAMGNEFDYCLVCHGSDAGGNEAIAAPNLTGLSEAYLRAQLKAFQRGYRGRGEGDHAGLSMTSAARALQTEEDLDAAVAYIATFPVANAGPTFTGDEVRGKALYTSCATCHGAAGEGVEALAAPRLSGQNDWYLLKQLADYRQGVRGGLAEDRQGTIMRSASSLIEDEAAARDLVAYINSLDGPRSPKAEATTPAMPTINSEDTPPMKTTAKAALLAGAVMLSPALSAQEITRHPLPNNSTFPIAEAVTVSAGTELTFHSGLLPAPANPDADPSSREFLGDTYTQTMSVLKRFEEALARKGMGLGDIIKMNVFLVGDPQLDGKMDFAGFMRAYSQFFGTEEQPNLPARAAVQVAGLARGAFIEIEVILAR